MAESTAYGMDMGMREGSGLSTWVDSGAIYGDQVAGRQVWRVGSGPVNKKLGHAIHLRVREIIQEMRLSRQLHAWARQRDREVPGRGVRSPG